MTTQDTNTPTRHPPEVVQAAIVCGDEKHDHGFYSAATLVRQHTGHGHFVGSIHVLRDALACAEKELDNIRAVAIASHDNLQSEHAMRAALEEAYKLEAEKAKAETRRNRRRPRVRRRP